MARGFSVIFEAALAGLFHRDSLMRSRRLSLRSTARSFPACLSALHGSGAATCGEAASSAAGRRRSTTASPPSRRCTCARCTRGAPRLPICGRASSAHAAPFVLSRSALGPIAVLAQDPSCALVARAQNDSLVHTSQYAYRGHCRGPSPAGVLHPSRNGQRAGYSMEIIRQNLNNTEKTGMAPARGRLVSGPSSADAARHKLTPGQRWRTMGRIPPPIWSSPGHSGPKSCQLWPKSPHTWNPSADAVQLRENFGLIGANIGQDSTKAECSRRAQSHVRSNKRPRFVGLGRNIDISTSGRTCEGHPSAEAAQAPGMLQPRSARSPQTSARNRPTFWWMSVELGPSTADLGSASAHC